MSVRVGARVAPSSGVRKLRRAVASTPSYDPLTAFDWLHVAWVEDPSWTPPADGGAVSSWRNGGSVGGDFDQAVGANQPTYRASVAALSDQPGIEFTTSKYLLRTFATVAEPCSVVALVQATAVDSRAYCDLATTTGGGTVGCLTSQSGTWGITGASAFGMKTGGTAAAGPHILVGYYAGASSALDVDGATVASGNTGTWTLNQAQLGGRNAAGDWMSGHYVLFGIVSGDIRTDPDYASFLTWAEGRYGPFLSTPATGSFTYSSSIES